MITRRASLAAKILCLPFVCFVCSVVAPAATFTTPITISETNATYDGQDIVISNTVVTIDGAHSFNSLLLTNSAVLTHSACTTNGTHKPDLHLANAVVV